MMKCSIITTCKGFRRHLEKSLSAMEGMVPPVGWEAQILVVDYGCPEGTFEWVRQHHPLVRAARVLGTGPHFNLPKALNIGARNSRCELLFFIDADDIPAPIALAEGIAAISQGASLINWTRKIGDQEPVCFGAAMVKKEVWHAVRGFDENLGGRHGLSDADFYRRVQNDHPFAMLPAEGWEHLEQLPGEGTKFYETNDYQASFQENARRIWERGGLVNPLGIGVAEIEYC